MIYSLNYITENLDEISIYGTKCFIDIFFHIVTQEKPEVFGKKILRLICYEDHTIFFAWVKGLGIVVREGMPCTNDKNIDKNVLLDIPSEFI